MANRKQNELVLQLSIDQDKAEAQMKQMKGKMRDIFKQMSDEANKMTYFKDAVDYLRQIDVALTDLRKKHGAAAVDAIYGGFGKQLRDELSKSFDLDGINLSQFGALRQQLQLAKSQDSKKELREAKRLMSGLTQALQMSDITKEISDNASVTSQVDWLSRELDKIVKKFDLSKQIMSVGFNMSPYDELSNKINELADARKKYIEAEEAEDYDIADYWSERVEKLKEYIIRLGKTEKEIMDIRKKIREDYSNTFNSSATFDSAKLLDDLSQILNITQTIQSTNISFSQTENSGRSPLKSYQELLSIVEQLVSLSKGQKDVDMNHAQVKLLLDDLKNLYATTEQFDKVDSIVKKIVGDQLDTQKAITPLLELFGVELPESIKLSSKRYEDFMEQVNKKKNATVHDADYGEAEAGAHLNDVTAQINALRELYAQGRITEQMMNDAQSEFDKFKQRTETLIGAHKKLNEIRQKTANYAGKADSEINVDSFKAAIEARKRLIEQAKKDKTLSTDVLKSEERHTAELEKRIELMEAAKKAAASLDGSANSDGQIDKDALRSGLRDAIKSYRDNGAFIMSVEEAIETVYNGIRGGVLTTIDACISEFEKSARMSVKDVNAIGERVGVLKSINAAYEELQKAQASGDSVRITKAQEVVDQYESQYAGVLAISKKNGKSSIIDLRKSGDGLVGVNENLHDFELIPGNKKGLIDAYEQLRLLNLDILPDAMGARENMGYYKKFTDEYIADAKSKLQQFIRTIQEEDVGFKYGRQDTYQKALSALEFLDTLSARNRERFNANTITESAQKVDISKYAKDIEKIKSLTAKTDLSYDEVFYLLQKYIELHANIDELIKNGNEELASKLKEAVGDIPNKLAPDMGAGNGLGAQIAYSNASGAPLEDLAKDLYVKFQKRMAADSLLREGSPVVATSESLSELYEDIETYNKRKHKVSKTTYGETDYALGSVEEIKQKQKALKGYLEELIKINEQLDRHGRIGDKEKNRRSELLRLIQNMGLNVRYKDGSHYSTDDLSVLGEENIEEEIKNLAQIVNLRKKISLGFYRSGTYGSVVDTFTGDDESQLLYNGMRAFEFDPDSFDESEIGKLIREYQRLHHEMLRCMLVGEEVPKDTIEKLKWFESLNSTKLEEIIPKLERLQIQIKELNDDELYSFRYGEDESYYEEKLVKLRKLINSMKEYQSLGGAFSDDDNNDLLHLKDMSSKFQLLKARAGEIKKLKSELTELFGEFNFDASADLSRIPQSLQEGHISYDKALEIAKKELEKLSAPSELDKAIQRLHELEDYAYSDTQDLEELNRLYQERLEIIKQIGEEQLKSREAGDWLNEYERALDVNKEYEEAIRISKEDADSNIYYDLDEHNFYDNQIVDTSETLERLLRKRLAIMDEINFKEGESYEEQLAYNKSLEDRIALMRELEGLVSQGIISKDDVDEIVFERGTLDERKEVFEAICNDISKDDDTWDDALERAQAELEQTYEEIIVKIAGKTYKLGPNMSKNSYRNIMKMMDGDGDNSFDEVESIEFVRKKIESQTAAVREQTEAMVEQQAVAKNVNNSMMAQDSNINSDQQLDAFTSSIDEKTEALNKEKGVVDTVVPEEVRQLETLRKKLFEVKEAVEAKTDAFNDEYLLVDGLVPAEVEALNGLLDALKEITAQIGLIDSGLAKINGIKSNIQPQDEAPSLADQLRTKATQYADARTFARENAPDLKNAGFTSAKDAKAFWRNANYDREDFKPTAMPTEQVDKIIDERIAQNILDGWFIRAASEYKPRLENIALSDMEVRNAGLNTMWSNYRTYSGKDIGFEEFLYSNIPVYRGKNSEKYTEDDSVISFTFDKSVAESFGRHILETVIRPIDTIGSYTTGKESEVLVRRDQLEAMPEFNKWLNNMASGLTTSFVQAIPEIVNKSSVTTSKDTDSSDATKTDIASATQAISGWIEKLDGFSQKLGDATKAANDNAVALTNISDAVNTKITDLNGLIEKLVNVRNVVSTIGASVSHQDDDSIEDTIRSGGSVALPDTLGDTQADRIAAIRKEADAAEARAISLGKEVQAELSKLGKDKNFVKQILKIGPEEFLEAYRARKNNRDNYNYTLQNATTLHSSNRTGVDVSKALLQIARFPEKYGGIVSREQATDHFGAGARVASNAIIPLGNGLNIAFGIDKNLVKDGYTGHYNMADKAGLATFDNNGKNIYNSERYISFADMGDSTHDLFGLTVEEMLELPTIQKAMSDFDKQFSKDYNISKILSEHEHRIPSIIKDIAPLFEKYSAFVSEGQNAVNLRNEEKSLQQEMGVRGQDSSPAQQHVSTGKSNLAEPEQKSVNKSAVDIERLGTTAREAATAIDKIAQTNAEEEDRSQIVEPNKTESIDPRARLGSIIDEMQALWSRGENISNELDTVIQQIFSKFNAKAITNRQESYATLDHLNLDYLSMLVNALDKNKPDTTWQLEEIDRVASGSDVNKALLQMFRFPEKYGFIPGKIGNEYRSKGNIDRSAFSYGLIPSGDGSAFFSFATSSKPEDYPYQLGSGELAVVNSDGKLLNPDREKGYRVFSNFGKEGVPTSPQYGDRIKQYGFTDEQLFKMPVIQQAYQDFNAQYAIDRSSRKFINAIGAYGISMTPNILAEAIPLLRPLLEQYASLRQEYLSAEESYNQLKVEGLSIKKEINAREKTDQPINTDAQQTEAEAIRLAEEERKLAEQRELEEARRKEVEERAKEAERKAAEERKRAEEAAAEAKRIADEEAERKAEEEKIRKAKAKESLDDIDKNAKNTNDVEALNLLLKLRQEIVAEMKEAGLLDEKALAQQDELTAKLQTKIEQQERENKLAELRVQWAKALEEVDNRIAKTNDLSKLESALAERKDLIDSAEIDGLLVGKDLDTERRNITDIEARVAARKQEIQAAEEQNRLEKEAARIEKERKAKQKSLDTIDKKAKSTNDVNDLKKMLQERQAIVESMRETNLLDEEGLKRQNEATANLAKEIELREKANAKAQFDKDIKKADKGIKKNDLSTLEAAVARRKEIIQDAEKVGVLDEDALAAAKKTTQEMENRIAAEKQVIAATEARKKAEEEALKLQAEQKKLAQEAAAAEEKAKEEAEAAQKAKEEAAKQEAARQEAEKARLEAEEQAAKLAEEKRLADEKAAKEAAEAAKKEEERISAKEELAKKLAEEAAQKEKEEAEARKKAEEQQRLADQKAAEERAAAEAKQARLLAEKQAEEQKRLAEAQRKEEAAAAMSDNQTSQPATDNQPTQELKRVETALDNLGDTAAETTKQVNQADDTQQKTEEKKQAKRNKKKKDADKKTDDEPKAPTSQDTKPKDEPSTKKQKKKKHTDTDADAIADPYKKAVEYATKLSAEGKNATAQVQSNGKIVISYVEKIDGLSRTVTKTYDQTFDNLEKTVVKVSNGLTTAISDANKNIVENAHKVGDVSLLTKYNAEYAKLMDMNKQYSGVEDLDEDAVTAWSQQIALVQKLGGEVSKLIQQREKLDLSASNKKLDAYLGEANSAFKGLDINATDGDQKAIADQHTNITGIIDNLKKTKKAATEEELRNIAELVDALKKQANAYKEANGWSDVRTKNFGATATRRETTRFNRLNTIATTEGNGYSDASSGFMEKFDDYKDLYDLFVKLQQVYANKPILTKDEVDNWDMLKAAVSSAGNELEKMYRASEKATNGADVTRTELLGPDFTDDQNGRKQALTDFAKQLHDVDEATIVFDKNYTKCIYTVDNGDGTFTKMTASLDTVSRKITETSGETKEAKTAFEAFFDELKGKARSIVAYLISITGIEEIFQQVRQGIEYVKEIDSALTELKKVTNATNAEYDAFLQTMSKTAGTVGSTISELTTMTAEWARLGYSMQDAAKLAESTAVLLNVSEFDDATKASEALISVMQAFQYTADESGHVVDILNEIGNSYAISSDGIATALQDSASALMTAGNNFEQSVALVAAANKVVQDPNQVGAAMRTIALRIRGTSVSVLEELGEETEGVVESTSKLQEKVKALSGVDILTESGAYKSTYEILKEIAEVFDDMSNMDQAKCCLYVQKCA